ncbi:MAG: ABC transporter ATP-binding protein [Patescibacteria group bacterium]
MTTVVKLDNLTKKYGESIGIEEISLSVPKGSVYGFLGPNGAGKSTTINLLLDLIRPTSGQLSIFNLDVRHNGQEIRRRTGYLSSDLALDLHLTGAQQLEYFANLHGNIKRSVVDILIARLGCQTDKKIKDLSRGNRQKIGLVAALMHQPELLILDEPTSGLDPLMQAEFNKLISEHKIAGGTTFISSHVLSEVQEICDRVAFVRAGKLITEQSVDVLTKSTPRHLRLWGTSQELLQKLKKLAGISKIQISGNNIQALYSGHLPKLLKLLANHPPADMTLTEADLETIFMNYYGEGDDV